MRALPVAVLCGLVFGSLGVACAIFSVVRVLQADILSAVVTLALSAFCLGFVIPFFKIVPGKVTPRIDVDEDGTVFRPDRGVDIPLQVSIVGLVIASAVYSIFSPFGKVDIPVPPSMRVTIPFIGALLVLVGVPLVWRNFRRGSTKYLRLTRDGFELTQGWTVRSGRWEQVASIGYEVPGMSTTAPGAVVFVMSDGTAASISANAITPDGSALRDLLSFIGRSLTCARNWSTAVR